MHPPDWFNVLRRFKAFSFHVQFDYEEQPRVVCFQAQRVRWMRTEVMCAQAKPSCLWDGRRWQHSHFQSHLLRTQKWTSKATSKICQNDENSDFESKRHSLKWFNTNIPVTTITYFKYSVYLVHTIWVSLEHIQSKWL